MLGQQEAPVANAGGGPRPSAALPFTGIEDVLLPLLLGAIVAMGGVVAYRHASLRENMMGRIAAAAGRPCERATGYAAALREIEESQSTHRSLWAHRVA